MNAIRREDSQLGAIVSATAVKVVVLVALLGVAGNDGMAIGRGYYGASDEAVRAASDAADAAKSDRDVNTRVQSAYDAAYAVAKANGDSVDTKTFRVDSSDFTVSLDIIRHIKTLVVGRVSFLKQYSVAVQHGTGKPYS